MSKPLTHPIRDVELVVYSNTEHGAIGFFGTDGKFPVYITGSSPEEVQAKGEAFRQSLLDEYEEKYVLRMQQAAKARAAKAKKGKKADD